MHYNPNQPRIPKGNEKGGEWTIAGIAARKAAGLSPQDTMQQYCRNGVWDPERTKLHNRIVNSYFVGKMPVKDPTAYIFGGGPASGKTTLLESGIIDIPDNTVLCAGDGIKAMLPEYEGGKNAVLVHEESSYLSRVIAEKAATENYNLIMDGTGDNSLANLTAKVNMLNGNNHPVEAIYATCDVKVAIQRSLQRAIETGRYMPESILRECHANVSRIFPLAVAKGLFGFTKLFDTGFSPPKLIASAVGNKLTVFDTVAYQKFLDKAGD
jgi:hypothetical protein